jgi:hypothetical protein
MPLLTDPDQLSQGTSSSETVAFTSSTGAQTTLTGTGLPAIAAGEFFEIRSHPIAGNNGLYVETGGTPSTSSVTCEKVSGSDPTDDTAEAVTWLGDSNTLAKNVMIDGLRKKILILEQEGLSADGVEENAVYSFLKEEFKDDDYLRQYPFPMFAIDLDAGKYQIGTDGANANGWNWEDVATHSVRTRKLIRNGGWSEVDANGVTQAIYPCIVTLGSFEDETPVTGDTAYYLFGTDTTVDNTTDFTFTGPVNEAVKAYEEIGNPDTFTFVDGGGGDDTVTRATGSFIDDGFVVGGRMNVRNANTPANDGSYVITGVAATTLTFATGSFNTGEADSQAQIAVDNRYEFSVYLRVRDADPNGKTFDQSNLTAIGRTQLNNFIFGFPLTNATDLKIEETDANIDANTPYTGMSITYFATPQSKSGLVGGSFNFGIVIDANGGTAQQVYEFVQRQLRKTTDIDADADTHIGRAMDALLVFEGDTLVAGKGIPDNPDGGGSGVFVENIAAVDNNNLTMFDNLGDAKTFPETVAVTLDFNAALINDTVAEYTLFYDRTIRTPNTTLTDAVLTSGATPTLTSAGGNLPTLNSGAGQYIRISGLTGADEAMNGIYQVVTETSTSSWDVLRADGEPIVTTSSAAVDLDQYPIDSPDAIIVQDNTLTDVTGLASADYQFNYDYDGNTQGGRTVSTPAYVVGRAIGLDGAQFVQSGVQVITSGTPLTIVLTASNELNYAT